MFFSSYGKLFSTHDALLQQSNPALKQFSYKRSTADFLRNSFISEGTLQKASK